MSFKPLNKSAGGCPICGRDDGACRQHTEDKDFIQCHTHADARKGEVVNNYVCVKTARGHTASFKPYNGKWSQEYATRQLQENHLREQKLQAEDKRRQQQALSVDERHKLYSDIINQLKLESTTTKDLQRRGFTPQEIERCEFKSVKKWQKLNKKYDKRLPGISKSGSSLAVSGNGYLCPLRDFDGRITGLQIRLHNPQDGCRYKWVSTPQNATLKVQPENENPLAVFHPPGEKPYGIAIVEGTGCKPYFVSQRLNYLTIGAAGGQWLSSQKLLEKYIKQAFEKYGYLPIVVIPDAGFALNNYVKKNLLDTFDWLKERFSSTEIKVLDWNQIHKSRGDIDELETEDLLRVRQLKLESFLKKYKEVFGEDSKGTLPKRYQYWSENRVKLTADIEQHEKWLTIPEGIQNECDILLIRKSLGGGKTQTLIEFLKALNKVSLLVGYRNSLLNNTIARANGMGLDALHIKDTVEMVQGNCINFASDESIKLWGGCADSFFKFNAIIDRNPEYYLIHDEVCSVLGHLKGGGTLKGRQQQAIDWVTNTINNSQFSIMMDANLSDREVEFIRRLFPQKKIKVLDSVYPTTPRTFYFLETASSEKDFTVNPKYLPTQLIAKAKQANKVLWISDSQRSCEVADEILTKHGHKHFRLDGKTSHDEQAKLFQANPKLFITTDQLDSLSISPSGESGLSIDLFNYFDAVCFDIRGTVSVNTLTQLSARLRDTNVLIYVACPEFSNMTSNPCPYAIKKVEKVIKEKIDVLLAKALATDAELVDSQFVADMFAEMGTKFSRDPWFIESLKDAKDLKYEHSNLKVCLKTALTQAGHRVIDLVDSASDKQHKEVKETKELVKQREAEKIFNSENIDWEEAQELRRKEVNYDTRCKIRKAQLKHRLPGIEKTKSWNSSFVRLVEIDDPQLINKRWRLKQLQDEELFKAVIKSENKFSFKHGFQAKDIWKSTSIKIEALKSLGVAKIIDTGIFSSQDTWVQEIVNRYYDEPEWFDLIGISKAKRTLDSDGKPQNLQYIKKMVERFVNFFGLEVKQTGRRNNNRKYSVVASKGIEQFLPDIDKCLQIRAESIIPVAKEISLKCIADEANEARLKDEEWQQQHKSELNKRILETQLTHNQSDMVPRFPNIYKEENENVALAENLSEEWLTPESISDVTGMLEFCDTPEMLTELRKCNIPIEVLKVAARQLPKDKYAQIKEWVVKMNATT